MAKSLILIISMLLILAAHATAASLQDRYLASRDSFIRKFANSAPEASADEQALSELEKQLRLTIGPLEIVGFPSEGKINLETLYQDGGFGQADGLRFDTKRELLFVTTVGLLDRYLHQHKELPSEMRKLAKDVEFYRLVFSWNVAVTHFADVPVRSTNDKSFASAFLGLWAQDIGLFLPEHLFVFVADGNRVFVVSAEAQGNVTQIAECKNVWDKFKKKSDAAFANYRASGLKDQKAISDTHRYEDEGFKAYCMCFDQKAKTEPFFKQLTRQAQTLVDNIQKPSPQ